MAEPLVEENRPNVALFAAANLVLGYAVLVGLPEKFEFWKIAEDLLASASAMALMGLVVIVLSGSVQPKFKDAIVAMRWGYKPPGYKAFTSAFLDDDRIDEPTLREKLGGSYPTEPKEQNRKWYQLFTTQRDQPSVLQASKSGLLTRDMGFLSLLAVLVGALYCGWEALIRADNPPWTHHGFPLYLIFLALQFLLTSRASYNYSRNLVANVLVEASHDKT